MGKGTPPRKVFLIATILLLFYLVLMVPVTGMVLRAWSRTGIPFVSLDAEWGLFTFVMAIVMNLSGISVFVLWIIALSRDQVLSEGKKWLWALGIVLLLPVVGTIYHFTLFRRRGIIALSRQAQ